MADMTCPRCSRSSLSEREREGVTIDVCPECRGVWLDRGELEKLIARATREIDQLERGQLARGQSHERRDDDDDRYDDRSGGGNRKRRKRGWLDAFDIFD